MPYLYLHRQNHFRHEKGVEKDATTGVKLHLVMRVKNQNSRTTMSTTLDSSRIPLHLAPLSPIPPSPPKNPETQVTFLTQFRLDRSLDQIGKGTMTLKM